MPVKPKKAIEGRDLASEWAEGADGRKSTGPDAAERKLDRLAAGTPKSWRFKPGVRTAGTQKGQKHKSTVAIKSFMLSILDNPKYRKSLTRRILSGELPQIELFMLTKTLGKPVEEINVTANVPLFSLPSAFVMREDEDVVEADAISAPYAAPQLGPGDPDGAD